MMIYTSIDFFFDFFHSWSKKYIKSFTHLYYIKTNTNTTNTNKMATKELIVKSDNFDPTEDNTKFYEAKPNKNGQGKNVRFTYTDNPLYISTPKLRNPFGFSRGPENSQQYGKKFTCTLSFDLKTPKGKEFKKSMEELQELLAKQAYENRVEWGLGKTKKEARDMTEKEVRRMMTPIVKVPVDKKTGEEISEYPPTFRVTFNTRNNEETGDVISITSEVYDQDGERLKTVDESTIKPNSQAKVLMYARSVWVTPSGFGINWRIHQIRVYPGEGLPTGRCLIDGDDSDDDSEDEVKEKSTRSSSVSSSKVTEKPVSKSTEEDADEDDDEDDEDRGPKRLSLRNRREE